MNVHICNRLAGKLDRIRGGGYTPSDFIIADAKDADMGGGINGVGFSVDRHGVQTAKTSADYLAAITEMMRADLVDIMLTSMCRLRN